MYCVYLKLFNFYLNIILCWHHVDLSLNLSCRIWLFYCLRYGSIHEGRPKSFVHFCVLKLQSNRDFQKIITRANNDIFWFGLQHLITSQQYLSEWINFFWPSPVALIKFLPCDNVLRLYYKPASVLSPQPPSVCSCFKRKRITRTSCPRSAIENCGGFVRPPFLQVITEILTWYQETCSRGIWFVTS